MSDTPARRPLALTATLATSVAVAAGLIAPAGATPPSPDGAAKLTLSNGTPQAGAPAAVTVGGASVGTVYAAGANQLSWAPDGSRAAWLDAAGDVIVGRPGGATWQITPPNTAFAVRQHPTWIDGGSRILWSEKTGSGNSILRVADANGLDKDASGAQIAQNFAPAMPAGTPNGDYAHPDAVGSILAFEFTPAGGATSIYVLDTGLPGGAAYRIADGRYPSVSPDGHTVAFVAPDGTAGNFDQIYSISSASGGGTRAAWTANTTPVATDPHPYLNPVWSPDGRSIVFEAISAGGQDVDTRSVTTGSTAESAVSGTPVTGLPAFQPQKKNTVLRLAGKDRHETAVDVSKAHWKTFGSTTSTGAAAKAVVLARSDQFADALGGSALAAKVGGPLLLTPPSALNAQASAEIQRVLGPGDTVKTVYILGGTAALSPAVATALQNLKYHVVRVQGLDRYSTAVAIANTITNNAAPDYIFLATGRNYADALSAGAAAGAINSHDGKNAVVLLTNDTTMPAPTIGYIAPLNNRTVLNPDHTKPATFIEVDTVGQQAQWAIDPQLRDPNAPSWIPPGYQGGGYSSFSGSDRYQTSQMVARHFFGGTGLVGLATGLNWADALSGGALMGTLDGPVLLIAPAGPTGSSAAYLGQSSGQLDTALIFGGTSAVGAGADQAVGAMIGGPAGVDYPAWNPTVG